MPMSPTQSQIEKKLTNEDLDELLHLWWAEQGAEKRRDLDLMAAAIRFRHDATLRVLDLCCGPGDVGRAIRARYPNSQIDCVDRDVFLISMCIGMNRREGVPAVSLMNSTASGNTDFEAANIEAAQGGLLSLVNSTVVNTLVQRGLLILSHDHRNTGAKRRKIRERES